MKPPEDLELEDHTGLYGLRKQFLQNTALGALGVAYFDFLLGLVGTIQVVLDMQKQSWYPVLVPVGQAVSKWENWVPIPWRWFLLGFYLAFVFLLLLSVFLFVGILMRQPCLINFWYCPNAIFLVVHALLVLACPFFQTWRAYAPYVTLFGLRIFPVLIVYKYQKALGFYKSENSRCLLPPPYYGHPKGFDQERGTGRASVPRRYELNNHHKRNINEGAQSASGAVFSRIENERRFEGAQGRGLGHEIPEAVPGYFENDQHHPRHPYQNEQQPMMNNNNGVFHSAFFLNSSGLRRQPPPPPPAPPGPTN